MRFTVEVVRDWSRLRTHLSAWEELAAAALEPNVFFEPWMLLPALEAYGQNEHHLMVTLIWAAPPDRSTALLAGLFPLFCRRGYRQLPMRVLRLWRYVHCFLGTPLIHAEHASGCLQAFFQWVAERRGGSALLELPWVTADGPFQRLLTEQLAGRRAPVMVLDPFQRPLLRLPPQGVDYLQKFLSGDRRKKIRQKERRLAEVGTVACATLQPQDNLDDWIHSFLELEASGWKGKKGTALACNEVDRHFFITVVQEAFRRQRLHMLRLTVNGRPVAQLCDFLGGDGAFSFKTAYDEEYADYSPGILLEVANIRVLQMAMKPLWTDSCMAPTPSTVTHLWTERREIHTLLIALGPCAARWWFTALTWLRGLKRALQGLCSRWRREKIAPAQ